MPNSSGKGLIENGSRNIVEESSYQEEVRGTWVIVFVVSSHVGEWTRVGKTLGFDDDRGKDIWGEFSGTQVQKKSQL